MNRIINILKGLNSIYHLCFLSFLLFHGFTFESIAQNNDTRVLDWMDYRDAFNSMYRHLANEAYNLLDYREIEVSKITTLQGWQQRQSHIKQVMWEVLGAFPEKTKLNARITGKVKKKGYVIENIIYESLPDFYVTASLFIPDKVKKPAPAILFCSGHTSEAYRNSLYQLPLLNLVKKGFIVLAIDPIGQGERLQYFNPTTQKSIIGSSTKEHSYPSPQISLISQSIARYFIWDGIRGIDYLISRKEVDPKRIGVHGLSGGGTQTAYISALDDRVAASAPACYITNFRRLIGSIGVQDGEQNFYHGILEGIDHADFIIARAPKPTLIMANTGDFFNIEGSRETYRESKKVFDIFKSSENIELIEADYGHGYTKENREALYAFFQKHLNLPGSSIEEEVEYVSAEELQKTTTGQLASSLNSNTVFDLNLKEVRKNTNALQKSRKNSINHFSSVILSAQKLSGYRKPLFTDKPVLTYQTKKGNYTLEKYFVKGEGNYPIPYVLYIPEKTNNKVVMYLHPKGKSNITENEIELLTKKGFTVLAADLLGIGELSDNQFKGDAFINDVSYNFFYMAMLTGKSIVGTQAADIIKLAHLFDKNNTTVTDIYCVAHEELSPVLLHAAAFDPIISRLMLINPYPSYRSIAENRFYESKFVYSIVPGALTAYDLPDLAATLAPRKLFIAGSKNITHVSDKDDTTIIEEAYNNHSARQQLRISSSELTENLESLFIELIK